MVELESGCRFLDPAIGTIGAAALEADSDAIDLTLGEGLVDVVGPVGGSLERPG